MLSKMKSWMSFDILERLILKYRQIPSVYKTSFWTVFIVLNIVYAFHTINFFWGNHEWEAMRNEITWDYFWFEARFTETLPYAVMGFRFIPVLLNLFGFAGLALSVVSLAHYWYVPKTKSAYICFGLTVSLLPYNLCWLYHIAQTSFFWGTAIIVATLSLFEKIRKKRLCFLYHLFVVLLFCFVLCFHAAFINVMVMCVIGHYFVAFIHKEDFKNILKDVLLVFVDIFVAGLLLKALILLGSYYDIVNSEFYNIQHIKISEVFSKFIVVWGYVAKEFLITYPFVDSKILHILQVFCIYALMCTLYQSIKSRGKLVGTASFALMLAAALFTTQLAIFISNNSEHLEFMFRLTGYFGLCYFVALMLAFLLQFAVKGWMKNVAFILIVALIGLSVQRDMYAMKVWKFGRDAEDKLFDRILARIESLDNFNYDRRYIVLMLGDISLRQRYYRFDYKEEDVSTLTWSYRAPWEAVNIFNFYAPTDFVFHYHNGYWNFDFVPEVLPRLSLETLRFIRDEAAPWPDKNSVFIRDSNLFIFLTEPELNEFKKIIKYYLMDFERRSLGR